ncbi:MAG: hypothetical protein J5791_12335, partial [Fibrobacter sp.]|nr:hypothetical protein [Fibrobacter sp.]
MNIGKAKVEKNREWSVATKKTLAAIFGVSATFSLTACLEGPTSGDMVAPDDGVVEESSDSTDLSSEALSSSSQSDPSSSSFKLDSLEVTSGIIAPHSYANQSSSSSVVPRSSSIMTSG